MPTEVKIEDAALAEAVKKASADPALAAVVKAVVGADRAIAKALKTDKGRAAVSGAVALLQSVKADGEEVPEELIEKVAALLGMEHPGEHPEEEEEEMKRKAAAAAATAKQAAGGIPLEPIVKADGSLDLSIVPEDRRPLAEAVWTQTIAARKQAKEFETALAKERKEREAISKEMRRREVRALVKERMGSTPGASQDDLSEALLALETAGVPEAIRTTIGKVLETSSAVVKELSPARGVDRPGDAGGGAYQQIVKAAAALREKDPKLTEAASMARVLETPEGKRLHRQHNAERVSA